MRDPQKKRVYVWENEWFDWCRGNLNLSECRAVVKWACDLYGLKTPRVAQHDDRSYSYCQMDPKPLINFRSDQKNASVALHEAAHYICDTIFGGDLEDHSPQWMGIFLWLLEGARIAPRTALHASARAKKIKWVQTWLVSPKRLGRRR